MYTSIFCHTFPILQSSAHINPFKDQVSIKISIAEGSQVWFSSWWGFSFPFGRNNVAVKSKVGYCPEARKGPEHQQPRQLTFTGWNKIGINLWFWARVQNIYLYGGNYTSQLWQTCQKCSHDLGLKWRNPVHGTSDSGHTWMTGFNFRDTKSWAMLRQIESLQFKELTTHQMRKEIQCLPGD